MIINALVKALLCSVCILIQLQPLLSKPKGDVNYYVDIKNGDDSFSGLSVTHAFKSIAHAKLEIKNLNKNAGGNIIIYIRKGIYFQDTTLVFSSNDCSRTNNIVFRNYANEEPVISGGKPIKGWELYDSHSNLYRAYVGDLSFRQLYINGKWGIRARFPNHTYNTDIRWDAANNTIKILSKNLSRWENFDKIELVTLNAWTHNHLRLDYYSTKLDTAYLKIKKEEQCVFKVLPFAFHGEKYFLENAFEFIDSTGEWYLNPVSHYLFYKAAPGEDMANAEVIAPVLTNILKVEGFDLNHLVKNLSFQGLTFMHTNWLRPDSFGNVEMQAAQVYMPNASSGDSEFTIRPEAGVLVKNAENITFERCTFANTGASALDFISGVRNSKIVGNVFHDIAGNGISVGLTAKETENNMTVYKPVDIREMSCFIDVSNNYITRVGNDNMGGVGIAYFYAANLNIVHNEIEHVPYSGISGGWGWNPIETSMCCNTINYNKIHDYMLAYCDGAGIYTLSNQPNTLYSYNYIENMKVNNHGYGWMALYADEGSRNLTITNNVCQVQQHDRIAWICLQNNGEGSKDCFIDHNYINTKTEFGNSRQPISNTHYCENAIWPEKAKLIIQNAGLEADFMDIKKNLK